MNLCYRTYPDADIIETWTEITHEEKKAITLNRFASAYLPIRKGDVWVFPLIRLMGKRGSIGTRTVTTGHQDDKKQGWYPQLPYRPRRSDDLPRRKTKGKHRFRYWRRPML